MARGKRFSFICGSSSAASRPTRPSSGDTAPQEDKMPTSQPMQRSTESLWSADTGSSYVESDSSNLSDASTRSDVSDTPTYPCPPYSRLHDPPSPDDASLLRKTRFCLVLTSRHGNPPIKGHTRTARLQSLLSSSSRRRCAVPISSKRPIHDR